MGMRLVVNMTGIQRISRQMIHFQASNLRAACICQSRLKTNSLLESPSINVVSRTFSDDMPSSTSLNNEDENLGNRALRLFGWLGGFYSRKAVLTRSAKVMYECCVEGVDYDKFYDAAGMPDTFQSWFLINQLHVWMCLVRLKPEAKDGQFMYRRMVQIFWDDVEERMKVIGVVDPSVRKQSLKELMQEFYGLILAYDEGLLSHDRVLAASIWRNMFHNKKNTDASNLARFVEYVRKQVLHLENIDSEKLLTNGDIEWLSFDEHVFIE